jgi:5-methyltetrahydrofolate--homocysteine methyltransferase
LAIAAQPTPAEPVLIAMALPQTETSLIVSWQRAWRSFAAARPLLWDGAVGTGLIARGLDLQHEPPEAWLLTHPEQVVAVHAEFAAAGADVLQTNSFGLVRLLLNPAGWPAALGPMPDVTTLVAQSVRLARQGAASRTAAAVEVIGCLGPTGRADTDADRLETAYAAVASAFVAAGVHTLHLETCLDPRELQLALRSIRSAAPELELVVSITLSMGQSGPETPLGTPLGRMLRELDQLATPPLLVGINCSQPARRLHGAVAALYQWAGGKLPILVQPQVGEPAPDCRHPAKPETPERFSRDLLRLRDEGAAAFGGCCGARGEHIRALREALDATARAAESAPATV